MTLPVINPFDGSEVAHVPLADEKGIDAAIAMAHATFEKTRKTPPFERARILSAAADALRRRRDEFAQTILAEAGKPITLAEAEVDRAIITLAASAEESRRTSGETIPIDGFETGKGHFGIAKRFPLGVIYGITPFNFPLNLVLHKVAPAIATGNTIVIKPSPRTPLSAIKISELLRESGVPEGQVNVVVPPNELATRAIDDPRVKMVSFTGSAPIGWKIKQQAAKKRVTLELGGNAAMIVHEDADLAMAVVAAATGAFSYAGQSCISVQRILVQERVYKQFRSMLITHIAEKVRWGDPRDRAILVGPMIDASAVTRVRGSIDEAVRAGATIVIGGQTKGPFLAPTILEKVDPKLAVCAGEIFAPVAVLQPYAGFDDAIAMANDTVYGLQSGVFTRDISRAWQAFEQLDVGGVMINQAPTWRVETMPYGGVKESGFGREGIRWAMEEMTEIRALVLRIE